MGEQITQGINTNLNVEGWRLKYSGVEDSSRAMVEEARSLLNEKAGSYGNDITNALTLPAPEIASRYSITRDGNAKTGYEGPLRWTNDNSEVSFTSQELQVIKSLHSFGNRQVLPTEQESAFLIGARRYLALRDAMGGEDTVKRMPQLAELYSAAVVRREYYGNGLKANRVNQWSVRNDETTVQKYKDVAADYPAAVLRGFADVLPSITSQQST